MIPEAFVEALDAELAPAYAALAEDDEAEGAPDGSAATVAALLRQALRNELEAAELAARWMVAAGDVEVKLALARQVGDEARHYRLIAERLAALGESVRDFDPLAGGPSPMFRFLAALTDPLEQMAAGPFAREGIAVVKNNQFIKLCEARGDLETARLYREIIEPEERFHHDLGRRLVLRLAADEPTQGRARAAALTTVEIAMALQREARRVRGVTHAPGC